MKEEDYRISHLKKGDSYHNEFLKNPYRSTIWELEQETLNIFLEKYFKNTLIPRYLDFACGTGRVLQYFEDKTISAMGVDVSDNMLKIARQNCSKAKLIVADITRTDVFLNDKFDLVTAFRFFPNAQESLRKEAAKVLSQHINNKGYLVFNNHMNAHSLFYRMVKFANRKNHKLGMSEDEIKEFLKDTDLKIIHKYHIGLLPIYDKKPILKKKYIKWIEKKFMKLPFNFIGDLSQNIIYVCQKE